MKYAKTALAITAATLVYGCSSAEKRMVNEDPYIWLESLESQDAKAWVERHNKLTRAKLEGDPRFLPLKNEIKKILAAKDRVAMPSQRGRLIRNFWQDERHVRGVWRETTFEEYVKPAPKWKILLDVDALNKAEKKSFVFSGANCLAPDYKRCLVRLSDGGKDKAIMREFDTVTRKFVTGGFELPEAKSSYDWIDRETVFLLMDTGPDSLTSSGYPRQVRIWRRGQPFKDAKLVFEGEKTDVAVSAYRNLGTATKNSFVARYPNFFESEGYWYKDGKLIRIPIPTTAGIIGDTDEFLIFTLRFDWMVRGTTFPAGAVLSLPLTSVKDQTEPYEPEGLQAIFAPSEKLAFSGLSITKSYLYLTVLNDVNGEIYRIERKAGGWERAKLPFPAGGMPAITDAPTDSDRFFATFESFGVPTSLYVGEGPKAHETLKLLKQLPPRFDAS
ncbi:MAG TPA: hypothetical protein VFV50_03535, partial [Bdellovibrionales bacterium]|nr:hypothetical protein [Bdellovibrionales bacterium]